MLALVASLSVAGCAITPTSSSPSPTPSPAPAATPATSMPLAYFSSHCNSQSESGKAIVERLFSKSTDERGNVAYEGITRSTYAPESYRYTTMIELTKSESEAEQLCDTTVAQKQGEGFALKPDGGTL